MTILTSDAPVVNSIPTARYNRLVQRQARAHVGATLPDADRVERLVTKIARNEYPILKKYHSRGRALGLLHERLERLFGAKAPPHKRDLQTFVIAEKRLEHLLGV